MLWLCILPWFRHNSPARRKIWVPIPLLISYAPLVICPSLPLCLFQLASHYLQEILKYLECQRYNLYGINHQAVSSMDHGYVQLQTLLSRQLTYLLISGRIKPVTSALQGGYSTQFTPVSHNHQLNNYSIKNTIINNIHYCLFNRKLNRWKHWAAYFWLEGRSWSSPLQGHLLLYRCILQCLPE